MVSGKLRLPDKDTWRSWSVRGHALERRWPPGAFVVGASPRRTEQLRLRLGWDGGAGMRMAGGRCAAWKAAAAAESKRVFIQGRCRSSPILFGPAQIGRRRPWRIRPAESRIRRTVRHPGGCSRGAGHVFLARPASSAPRLLFLVLLGGAAPAEARSGRQPRPQEPFGGHIASHGH